MVSRRDFLKYGTACCAAGAGIGLPSFGYANPLPQDATDVEVYYIYQAGGNDTLHNFVPYTDPLYRQLRPTLGFEAPEEDPVHSVLDFTTTETLNGTDPMVLGLNPGMEKYKQLHDAGLVKTYLASSHMFGGQTGSHFRGTDMAMWGLLNPTLNDSGWMARMLNETESDHAIRGYSITNTLDKPITFNGNEQTAALKALADTDVGDMGDVLSHLYRIEGADNVASEMAQGIQAWEQLSNIGQDNGDIDLATLNSNFHVQTQVAALLDAQAKVLVHPGYDFHQNQNRGIVQNQNSLSRRLESFWDAIYQMVQTIMARGKMEQTVIFIMSEFGRRGYEGSAMGSDHGKGGHLNVIGSPSRLRNMGMVYSGEWAGLSQLDDGNLPFAIDTKKLMAQDLWDMYGDHLSLESVVNIFPDIDPTGLIAPGGQSSSGEFGGSAGTAVSTDGA